MTRRPCSQVLSPMSLTDYSDSYLLVPFYTLYTGGCVMLKIGMWLRDAHSRLACSWGGSRNVLHC